MTEYYSANKQVGLDIGCGMRPYDRFFRCRYVGLDLPLHLSPRFGGGIAKPEIFGTVTELPFRNDTFDLITCYSVIPYVKEVDKLFSEMYRVMKPKSVAWLLL